MRDETNEGMGDGDKPPKNKTYSIFPLVWKQWPLDHLPRTSSLNKPLKKCALCKEPCIEMFNMSLNPEQKSLIPFCWKCKPSKHIWNFHYSAGRRRVYPT
jgi:hypothetical protein